MFVRLWYWIKRLFGGVKLQKENLKLRYYLGVSVFIIGGLLLLIFSQFISSNFWKNIMDDIAGALFMSGAFGLINELILKDKMIALILEKLKIKEEIDKTGILSFYKSPEVIDYKYYLSPAKKNIDIFHVYGRTWTHNNYNVLQNKVKNSNCKIRVILVNPDSKFIDGLADTFNCSPTELKGRILEVEKSWRALYKEKERQRKRRSQSSLELYYTDCFPAHSLYRFDDNLIHIQSKPTKGRSNELTTIVCKKTARADDLYNKYLQEIEDIIAESTRVDLENQPVLSF